jgi:hypothetical protein
MISGDIPTKGQSNIKFMYRYMSNNCKYWIILAVNTPESLLCCPGMRKVFTEPHSFNHESGSYTRRRRRKRNIAFTAEGIQKLQKNLNPSKTSDSQSDL